MVVVEEGGSIALEDGVGDEEGFDGGKATCGVGTLCIATGVGGCDVGWERPCNEGLFNTSCHHFCVVPGRIYEENAEMGVCFCQGWTVEVE